MRHLRRIDRFRQRQVQRSSIHFPERPEHPGCGAMYDACNVAAHPDRVEVLHVLFVEEQVSIALTGQKSVLPPKERTNGGFAAP